MYLTLSPDNLNPHLHQVALCKPLLALTTFEEYSHGNNKYVWLGGCIMICNDCGIIWTAECPCSRDNEKMSEGQS